MVARARVCVCLWCERIEHIDIGAGDLGEWICECVIVSFRVLLVKLNNISMAMMNRFLFRSVRVCYEAFCSDVYGTETKKNKLELRKISSSALENRGGW